MISMCSCVSCLFEVDKRVKPVPKSLLNIHVRLIDYNNIEFEFEAWNQSVW